mmetsp:Transcript_19145/g.32792  ORF Transcript_19145/g.32792 Transcript_19145/m.32792 type:complete len:84 (-) Transcript_19145:1078-1329(-)
METTSSCQSVLGWIILVCALPQKKTSKQHSKMSVLSTLSELPYFIKALILVVMGLQGAAFLAWFLMLKRELLSEGKSKKEKIQ